MGHHILYEPLQKVFMKPKFKSMDFNYIKEIDPVINSASRMARTLIWVTSFPAKLWLHHFLGCPGCTVLFQQELPGHSSCWSCSKRGRLREAGALEPCVALLGLQVLLKTCK